MPYKISTGTSEDKHGQYLAQWFQEKTNTKLGGPFSAIGIYKDVFIDGVIIFPNYNGTNIDIHVYAPNCFNRWICRYVFNYVFNELKCIRLTANIERKNKRMLKLLPRTGFIYEATLKKFYGPDKSQDGIILTLFQQNIPNWAKIDAERSEST